MTDHRCIFKLIDGSQCLNIVKNQKKFCSEHAQIIKNADYHQSCKGYDKFDCSFLEIDHVVTIEDLNQLIKKYGLATQKIRECILARQAFTSRYIHPDAQDAGHEWHINKILKQFSMCYRNLESLNYIHSDLYDKTIKEKEQLRKRLQKVENDEQQIEVNQTLLDQLNIDMSKQKQQLKKAKKKEKVRQQALENMELTIFAVSQYPIFAFVCVASLSAHPLLLKELMSEIAKFNPYEMDPDEKNLDFLIIQKIMNKMTKLTTEEIKKADELCRISLAVQKNEFQKAFNDVEDKFIQIFEKVFLQYDSNDVRTNLEGFLNQYAKALSILYQSKHTKQTVHVDPTSRKLIITDYNLIFDFWYYNSINIHYSTIFQSERDFTRSNASMFLRIFWKCPMSVKLKCILFRFWDKKEDQLSDKLNGFYQQIIAKCKIHAGLDLTFYYEHQGSIYAGQFDHSVKQDEQSSDEYPTISIIVRK